MVLAPAPLLLLPSDRGWVYDRPPMFTRTFAPPQFLRHAYGTEPFVQYCQSRHLPFEQIVGFPMKDEDYYRWQSVLRKLPDAEQARVELELAQVNELADAEAAARLVEAAHASNLPSDSVPGQTALAMWFFLHHPDLFHEVFLQQEIGEVDSWRTVKAPAGIALQDLTSRQEALAESLKEFFRVRDGTGRFCAVDAYRLGEASCFVAYLSDRLHLFEVFTDGGKRTTQAARPAFPVFFAYHPGDGRILLKAKQRAADKILDLFRRFSRAVLGIELEAFSLTPAFRLDLLKRRFDPLPDAEDMEMVRVKALHFVYPERAGRRRLKLETLSGDSQFAILELLQEHGGREGIFDQLDVQYAELQVKMRVEGRKRTYCVRMWPDRCSLNHTAFGERLRACLKRWGIAYAA